MQLTWQHAPVPAEYPSCVVQERARWGVVMEALHLAPRQQEALLALRKQHLLWLTSIYQDRQALNMQVRSCTQVHVSPHVPPPGPSAGAEGG